MPNERDKWGRFAPSKKVNMERRRRNVPERVVKPLTVPTWVEPFLDAFGRTANTTLACTALNIHRATPYGYAEGHPEFQQRWDEARQRAYDLIEGEMHRRGVLGIEEPVISGGKVMMVNSPDGAIDEAGDPVQVPMKITRYSDALILRLAEANRPDRFARRGAMELTGKGGGPIKIAPETREEATARMTHQLELIQGGNESQ